MSIPWKNLLLLVVLFGGGIALQIFLSKRKNKWLGLLLPTLCLLFSGLVVQNIAIYALWGDKASVAYRTIINDLLLMQQQSPFIVDTETAIFQLIIVFLLFNIPTVILLIIYFACREQVKKNSQLEKMNIQDLE